MKRDSRLDMKLQSREMFRYLMQVYHYSVRTLADDVAEELARAQRAGGPAATCSKSHIGNLRADGGTGVVSREIALAIEKLLQVAPGVLFKPRMSSVSVDTAFVDPQMVAA